MPTPALMPGGSWPFRFAVATVLISKLHVEVHTLLAETDNLLDD
jgi:hypothetical protein